ncbi:amino acid adenylation domain-containing protein [Pseudoalteromonas rubra]|uniref:amino acid adenylation domain-containing protein n=1 Tax=Pseudoalteromonas rubra TaxID=43658 RepID=UPI000F787530|nr:amino acid adenylation domain-containing protein [Pseudoalteromonas rubra]
MHSISVENSKTHRIIFQDVPGILGEQVDSNLYGERHSEMLSPTIFNALATAGLSSSSAIYHYMVAMQIYQTSQMFDVSQGYSFVKVPNQDAFVLLEFDLYEVQSWRQLFNLVDDALVTATEIPGALFTVEQIAQSSWIGTPLFICPDSTTLTELSSLPFATLCLAVELQGEDAKIVFHVNGGVVAKVQLSQYASCFAQLCLQSALHIDEQMRPEAMWSVQSKQAFIELTNPKSFELSGVQNLPAQLSHCAQSVPNKVALVCQDETLTFAELAVRVERMMAALIDSGVNTGDSVACYLQRDMDWAVLKIATMSLGAIYVPIDTSYPVERIGHMLSQAEAKVCVYKGLIPQELGNALGGVKQVAYTSLNSETPCFLQDCAVTFAIDSVAYIQFTSGTTGMPKGAMVEHKGMINHIFSKINDLNIQAHDVIAQTASQCFDVSIWQLLCGLYSQSTTVIYPDSVVWDLTEYMEYTRQHQVTVLEVVPSYLDLLMDEQDCETQKYFDDLLFLMVTGERVTVGQLARWFKHYADIPVINAYGPTEASDDITHYKIDKHCSLESVPIGFPIANACIYVLGSEQQLLPYGSVGEICVAGLCVGRGYINRPEETERAFIIDPIQPQLQQRMYRTGDIGRWLADGSLAYLGRNDQQVKVMGVRIELTEIEQKLSAIDGIKDVAVLCLESNIIGVYSTVSEKPLNERALRGALQRKLPSHSIPSKLLHRATMPLNANGKIDKKILTSELMD